MCSISKINYLYCVYIYWMKIKYMYTFVSNIGFTTQFIQICSPVTRDERHCGNCLDEPSSGELQYPCCCETIWAASSLMKDRCLKMYQLLYSITKPSVKQVGATATSQMAAQSCCWLQSHHLIRDTNKYITSNCYTLNRVMTTSYERI